MSSTRWSSLVLFGVASLSATGGVLVGKVLSREETQHRDRGAFAAIPHGDRSAEFGSFVAHAPTDRSNGITRMEENGLLRPPASPAAEKELLAYIENLAATKPHQALALSSGVSNLRIRAALLRAALRGWGKADAAAAVTWAKTQAVLDGSQALNAVLEGAVQNPDKATGLVANLIAGEPQRALEFGNDLVASLAEAGEFVRAVEFAQAGPVNCREDWMLVSFSRWAEFQPEAAAAAASRISDPSLRAIAVNAVMAGWAPTDPRGLIEFSGQNFSRDQQKTALASAIGFWAESDPVAAADWIDQNDPGVAADSGVATIALSAQLVQKPETAVNWASFIANPQLRSETLTTVIERWAATDAASARAFARHSPVLTAEDRSQIVAQLDNRGTP